MMLAAYKKTGKRYEMYLIKQQQNIRLKMKTNIPVPKMTM